MSDEEEAPVGYQPRNVRQSRPDDWEGVARSTDEGFTLNMMEGKPLTREDLEEAARTIADAPLNLNEGPRMRRWVEHADLTPEELERGIQAFQAEVGKRWGPYRESPPGTPKPDHVRIEELERNVEALERRLLGQNLAVGLAILGILIWLFLRWW